MTNAAKKLTLVFFLLACPAVYGSDADTLYPTGDSTTEWTLSAGTDSYANVDEDASPDDDWNYEADVNGVDIYELESVTPGSTIDSVYAFYRLRKNAAHHTCKVKRALILDGSTSEDKSELEITSTVYSTCSVRHVSKPGGGSWSASDFDDLRTQIKATTMTDGGIGSPYVYISLAYVVVYSTAGGGPTYTPGIAVRRK